MEDSMQKDNAEHEGYAGVHRVHNPVRITETGNTNVNGSKEGLLEEIVSRDNMSQAFKRVKANKGSNGIDGAVLREQFRVPSICGTHTMSHQEKPSNKRKDTIK